MKLDITLSPPNLFWFLPDGSAHVSVESPGPVEVDFLSLSQEYKKLVILGARNKSIALSVGDTELVEIYNSNQPHFPPWPTTPPERPPISEQVIDKHVDLESILNKSNNTIKKEIGLLDSIRSLKILLELETRHQNRHKIKALIQEKLDSIEEVIKQEIIADINPNAVSEETLPEIVESEIEIREVPLDGE